MIRHCAWCLRPVIAPEGIIALVCAVCTQRRIAEDLRRRELDAGIEPRTAVNLLPRVECPDPFDTAEQGAS